MINKNNIWLKCLEELSDTISEKEMRLWIKPLSVRQDDNEIKLFAPNKFMKEEVEKNFLSKILSTLNRLNMNMLVSLNIGSNVQHRETLKEVPSGFKTNLNKEMTFDTFVEGKSNQLAKAAALASWLDLPSTNVSNVISLFKFVLNPLGTSFRVSLC